MYSAITRDVFFLISGIKVGFKKGKLVLSQSKTLKLAKYHSKFLS
jgi:hypothetical protein